MATWDGTYCNDEDIAVRALSDVPALAYPNQRFAEGSDGKVDAGTPWTLTSSVDFEARGVAPGCIVVLAGAGPGVRLNPRTPAPDHSVLAVAAVSGTSLDLRRIGMDQAAAEPPPAGEGLAFYVPTFLPQIRVATRSLEVEFNVSGVSLPQHEFRDACALTVLHIVYSDRNRSASIRPNQEDHWGRQMALRFKELEAEKERLRERWGVLARESDKSRYSGVKVVGRDRPDGVMVPSPSSLWGV